MSQQLNQQQELIIALMQRLHTCEAELALYKEKHQQSTRAYDQLLHAFKQIQRRQFGTNSERFLDKNPGQLDFLSEVPAQDIAEDKESDNTIEAANDNSKSTPKKRSKKTHGQFAKNLPRREVIIYADKPGDNSIVIRYEITELLHYVPPVYEVVVQKREVVVTQDKETNVSTLTIAPNPKRLLPKVGATESFLAHMIVSKLYDRQPLYHLEKRFV